MTLIFSQKNVLNNKSIPSDVKSQYEFCTFFSLHLLLIIASTIKSATTINIISANYPERVIRQGINDVRLSIHQLIFCTRNISRIKKLTDKHIKFRSFKCYSADFLKETLANIIFLKTKILKTLLKPMMISFRKLWLQVIRQRLLTHFMPLFSFDTSGFLMLRYQNRPVT